MLSLFIQGSSFWDMSWQEICEETFDKKFIILKSFFDIWYQKNCFERDSRHLIRKMLSPLLKDQFPQDLHERSWEVFGETCFQLDIYSPYWLFSRSRKKHDFFILSGLDIFHTDFSHVLEKRSHDNDDKTEKKLEMKVVLSKIPPELIGDNRVEVKIMF